MPFGYMVSEYTFPTIYDSYPELYAQAVDKRLLNETEECRFLTIKKEYLRRKVLFFMIYSCEPRVIVVVCCSPSR